MRGPIAAFVSGSLFAAGLVAGGMTQPSKVIGFLDFTGNWDPSLAFVMVGAIGVYAVAYRLISKRRTPLFVGRFMVPTRRDLDTRLILGSALFGIGWGLAGYCPGPGIVSMGSFSISGVLFVAMMLTGMWLHRVVDGALQRRKAAEAGNPEGVATVRRI